MAQFVFVATILWSVPVISEEIIQQDEGQKSVPSALQGYELAKHLCVNCHIISGDDNASVSVGVPTFNEIANRRDQTAARIRGILIAPHRPMPNMHLSRAEMDDIIAYLDSLRDDSSGSPLLPIDQYEDKPKYPEPS